jgi:hypothetical protein
VQPSPTQGQEYLLRTVCTLSLVLAVLIPIVALLLLNMGAPLDGCCDQVGGSVRTKWLEYYLRVDSTSLEVADADQGLARGNTVSE